MSERKKDVISIIPLSFGSILLFASGSGFVSSRYPVLAGLLCFMFSGLVEIMFKKKFKEKSNQ